MQAGVIRVDFAALEKAMRLRPGHKIIYALPPDEIDIVSRRLRLVIEGPSLPTFTAGVHPVYVDIETVIRN